MDFKFENYFDDGTDIWIVPSNSSGLYRLDKKTGIVDLVDKLPKEYPNGSLFYGIVVYGSKIYLIPHKINKMLVYDLTAKLWDSFMLPDIECASNIWNKSYFYTGILYKQYIYMFGYMTPAIVRFNIETSTFEQLCDVVKEKIISILC
jgi:hypothetical protein